MLENPIGANTWLSSEDWQQEQKAHLYILEQFLHGVFLVFFLFCLFVWDLYVDVCVGVFDWVWWLVGWFCSGIIKKKKRKLTPELCY